jgi:hypothetical protein
MKRTTAVTEHYTISKPALLAILGLHVPDNAKLNVWITTVGQSELHITIATTKTTEL